MTNLASSMDDYEIANHLNQGGLTRTRETIRVFLSLKPPACSVYLPERSDTAFFVGRIPARKPGCPWEILIDDTNLESIKTLYT